MLFLATGPENFNVLSLHAGPDSEPYICVPLPNDGLLLLRLASTPASYTVGASLSTSWWQVGSLAGIPALINNTQLSAAYIWVLVYATRNICYDSPA